MTTLREDMMDMVRKYRESNDDFCDQQTKDSVDSLVLALRYKIRADSADILAMRISDVLAKHGL